MQFLVLRKIPLIRNNVIYDEPPKEEVYTEVPKVYDEKNWPSFSNRPCYICTIVTKRKPFFVPCMITSDGKIHRGPNHIVCGPSCGMRWIMEKSNDDSESRRYFSYMQELIHRMTGYRIRIIEPSQDKGELKKFGGQLTDHQYQRELIISSGDYMRNLYSCGQDYENDLS